MNSLKKLCDACGSVINVLLVLMAVVMMVVGVLQILFRYVFAASLSWSEELMRYLHVWITTIGGAACFYAGSFSVITIISEKLEAAWKPFGKIVAILRFILPLTFYGLLLYQGAHVCEVYMGKVSATMQLPMGIVFLCIPISGILGLVFGIAKLPELISKLKGGDAS